MLDMYYLLLVFPSSNDLTTCPIGQKLDFDGKREAHCGHDDQNKECPTDQINNNTSNYQHKQ